MKRHSSNVVLGIILGCALVGLLSGCRSRQCITLQIDEPAGARLLVRCDSITLPARVRLPVCADTAGGWSAQYNGCIILPSNVKLNATLTATSIPTVWARTVIRLPAKETIDAVQACQENKIAVVKVTQPPRLTPEMLQEAEANPGTTIIRKGNGPDMFRIELSLAP